jgi:hypothetical protein
MQKRITFACQSKKSITSTHACKREVNHLHVIGGNRYATGMLEGIFNHLSCGIVEDKVGFILANDVGQAIIFLHAKEN